MTRVVGSWTGAARLVRHAARRDRVLVAAWTLVLVAVCYSSAAATESLYPAVSDRVSAATAINASPSVVALYGPILDVRSLGEISMTKMTVLYAVFVALLLLVVVRRHTRTEEESGRAELLGGTAIGHDAPLAAAVSLGALISVAVGAPGGTRGRGRRTAGRGITDLRCLVGRDRVGRRPASLPSPASSRPARARAPRSQVQPSACSSCCERWGTPPRRG